MHKNSLSEESLIVNIFVIIDDFVVDCNSYCENIQFKTFDLLFVIFRTNSFGVL